MFYTSFGYEGLKGEKKLKSSETEKLADWQTEKMAKIWKMET